MIAAPLPTRRRRLSPTDKASPIWKTLYPDCGLLSNTKFERSFYYAWKWQCRQLKLGAQQHAQTNRLIIGYIANWQMENAYTIEVDTIFMVYLDFGCGDYEKNRLLSQVYRTYQRTSIWRWFSSNGKIVTRQFYSQPRFTTALPLYDDFEKYQAGAPTWNWWLF